MERPVGRLTAEVIARAPQGFNAVKDYEIDLRGAAGVRRWRRAAGCVAAASTAATAPAAAPRAAPRQRAAERLRCGAP